MNAELELHAAILDKLGASIPNIFGNDAPVLDNVTQDQKAPYITVGDALLNDFSADVTTGFNALFTINVWSDYLGQAERKYCLLSTSDDADE